MYERELEMNEVDDWARQQAVNSAKQMICIWRIGPQSDVHASFHVAIFSFYVVVEGADSTAEEIIDTCICAQVVQVPCILLGTCTPQNILGLGLSISLP